MGIPEVLSLGSYGSVGGSWSFIEWQNKLVKTQRHRIDQIGEI